ncbi:hypothetical protein LDENG_00224960 [Lucifuga dentata]|nr:hypothetical protein LDENG_00224960 [Lucifuga dentata]
MYRMRVYNSTASLSASHTHGVVAGKGIVQGKIGIIFYLPVKELFSSLEFPLKRSWNRALLTDSSPIIKRQVIIVHQ